MFELMLAEMAPMVGLRYPPQASVPLPPHR
jgi:hypothetical protein